MEIMKKAKPRIAFLHIPKTAGQSVHHFIAKNYTEEEICPARTNDQLYKYSLNELKKFKFYSGHLDLSVIQNLGHFDLTFTVLRTPMERILSFYLYLRKEALRKSAENPDIDLPYGLRLAKESSLEEYFNNKDKSVEMFINNHYNNFYSYYMAAGSYNGYQKLSKTDLTKRELLSMACMNSSLISNIYFIDNLGRISQEMFDKFGFKDEAIKKINQNNNNSEGAREIDMDQLCNGWDWRDKFNQYTKIDDALFMFLRSKIN